jgi:hypothetical protein
MSPKTTTTKAKKEKKVTAAKTVSSPVKKTVTAPTPAAAATPAKKAAAKASTPASAKKASTTTAKTASSTGKKAAATKKASSTKTATTKTAASAAPKKKDVSTVKLVNDQLKQMNYNIDSKGHAYRTFKLVSVDGSPITKEHSATQSSRKKVEDYDENKKLILCPRNAASKIFTSWCYANKSVDVLTKHHVICIKETTRKSAHRYFYYSVIREKKENTYKVTSSDGTQKNIYSNYTNRLSALKKKDIQEYNTKSKVPITATTTTATSKTLSASA